MKELKAYPFCGSEDIVKCGNCGKLIDMSYYIREEYVYRTTKKVGNNSCVVIYFCGSKCKKEALARYADEREQQIRATVEKRRQTRLRNKGVLI